MLELKDTGLSDSPKGQSFRNNMNSQLKIAQLSTWIVSAFLAIILSSHTITFLIEQDHLGVPEGVTSSFMLVEAPEELNEDSFISHLKQQADSQGATIYKISPGNDLSGRITDYYIFPSPESTIIGNIETEKFPSFTPIFQGRLSSGENLTADKFLGTYSIQGNPDASSEILQSFIDKGGTGYSRTYHPIALYWIISVTSSIWLPALGIILLATLLTLAQLLSERSSIRANRISFGWNSAFLWTREIGSLIIPIFTPSILSFLALYFYSLIFREGYRTSTLSHIFLAWCLILIFLAIASIISFTVVTYRYSIFEVIQGRKPNSLLATISILVIIIGTLGTLISISQSVNLSLSYKNSIQADILRSNTSEKIVEPIYGYALQTEHGDKALEKLDSIYEDLESKNKIYINSPRFFQNNVSYEDSQSYILVNPSYLEEFTTISTENLQETVRHTSNPGGVIVLTSNTNAKDIEIINDNVLHYLQETPAASKDTRLDIKFIYSPEIELAPLLNENPEGENFVEDPIIIVGSYKSQTIRISSLASNDISYEIDYLKKSVSELGISDTVISYNLIENTAQIQKNRRTVNLISSLTGSLFSVLALLGAAWTLATSFHSQNRRQIFLQSVAGENFWKKYKSLYHIFSISIALSVLIFISDSALLQNIIISIITPVLVTLVFTLRVINLEKKLTPDTIKDL